MSLLNKINHMLTADITKDFKLKKKSNYDASELTFITKKRRSIVILFSESHKKIWNLVREVQRQFVPK